MASSMERLMGDMFRGSGVRGGMHMGRRKELYLAWTDSPPRLPPSWKYKWEGERKTSREDIVERHHGRVHDFMRGKVNNVIGRERGGTVDDAIC